MGQEEIFEIIKASHIPLSADKIRIRLLNRGILSKEATFYRSIKYLEKDKNIHFKDIKVQDTDFIERVWWYDPMAKKTPLNEDLAQKIKRFANISGSPPRYSDSKKEFALKLKREGENWLVRYEQYKKNDAIIREDFKIGIGRWITSAKRFSEFSPLKEELSIILKEI